MPYAHLASLPSPSKVIYLAEAGEKQVIDHYVPMCWSDPVDTSQCDATHDWDNAKQEPTSLAVHRHLGGSNYLYADGHVKWQKFSSVWFRNLNSDPPIYAGAFDPRQ